MGTRQSRWADRRCFSGDGVCREPQRFSPLRPGGGKSPGCAGGTGVFPL